MWTVLVLSVYFQLIILLVMLKIWKSEREQFWRIVVKWNKLGQPIGKEGGILGQFLGTIARNGGYFPIHIRDWRKIKKDSGDTILQVIHVCNILQDNILKPSHGDPNSYFNSLSLSDSRQSSCILVHVRIGFWNRLAETGENTIQHKKVNYLILRRKNLICTSSALMMLMKINGRI
jgi:hypothetical protein